MMLGGKYGAKKAARTTEATPKIGENDLIAQKKKRKKKRKRNFLKITWFVIEFLYFFYVLQRNCRRNSTLPFRPILKDGCRSLNDPRTKNVKINGLKIATLVAVLKVLFLDKRRLNCNLFFIFFSTN